MSSLTAERRGVIVRDGTLRGVGIFSAVFGGEATSLTGFTFAERALLEEICLVATWTGASVSGTLKATAFRGGLTVGTHDVFSASIGTTAASAATAKSSTVLSATADFGTSTVFFIKVEHDQIGPTFSQLDVLVTYRHIG